MSILRRCLSLDALRWTLSAVIVVTVYGLLGWCFLFNPIPVEDTGGGEPAVEIDLQAAPLSTPLPPSDLPAGPPQIQPASQAEAASTKPVEKIEPDKPSPPDDAKSEASLPVPPKPRPKMPLPQAPQAEAPLPAAPPSAEAPPGQSVPAAPGQPEKPSNHTVLTWQRLLVGRLERSKRYPAAAGGREGATTVAFTIDRAGRLLASRIVESSGSPLFDAATLALVTQSQPFPPPPQGLGEPQLSFVITIRYAR